MMLRELFDAHRWFDRLITGLSWVQVAVLSVFGLFALSLRPLRAIDLIGQIKWLYLIYLVVRGYLQRSHGAKTLVRGITLSIAIAAIGNFLWVFGAGPDASTASYVGNQLLNLSVLVLMVTLGLTIAARYRRSHDDLVAAHRASTRFVPADFLRLLGRESVTEVERGDATKRTMTVLFADVRGFSTRSEMRSPEDNFAWLNRYLEMIEPVIRERGDAIPSRIDQPFD